MKNEFVQICVPQDVVAILTEFKSSLSNESLGKLPEEGQAKFREALQTVLSAIWQEQGIAAFGMSPAVFELCFEALIGILCKKLPDGVQVPGTTSLDKIAAKIRLVSVPPSIVEKDVYPAPDPEHPEAELQPTAVRNTSEKAVVRLTIPKRIVEE